MGLEGAIYLPVFLYLYIQFQNIKYVEKQRKEMMEKINERNRIRKILDLGYELLED
jgi:hypothetical protein